MGEDILLATTGTLHAVKIANSRRNNVSKRGVHLLQRCSAGSTTSSTSAATTTTTGENPGGPWFGP